MLAQVQRLAAYMWGDEIEAFEGITRSCDVAILHRVEFPTIAIEKRQHS